MPSIADQILDRRSLRRALTRWRVLAIVAAVAAVGALIYAAAGYRIGGEFTNHVARVSVSGFIGEDREKIAMLERLARSGGAKAVIVSIGSPGGTVPGSEALHQALRELSKAKPTVAVVESMAASGGYIAAMGADRIFAKQTSLVGSIGVLFQFPDVSKLLDTVGVKMERIKSAPLKAEPSGYAPTSEAARAAMNELIVDTFNWFKGMVRERRGIEGAALDAVADGRVFTGRQALELKLIDAIGDEKAALDWLIAEKKIPRRLPIRDWRPPSSLGASSLWSLSAWSLRFVGLETAARAIENSYQLRDLFAGEGLLALWQPPTER